MASRVALFEEAKELSAGRVERALATSHPWEDFAETWAHYLHIVDTLEMAAAFGVDIHPALAKSGDLDAKVNFDPLWIG